MTRRSARRIVRLETIGRSKDVVSRRSLRQSQAFSRQIQGLLQDLRPAAELLEPWHRENQEEISTGIRVPVFCDKLAASAFACARSPVVRSAEVYWSGDDLNAMPLESIPPPFVVKASNRSRAVVLVSSARELDAARIRSQCRAWLGSRPYGAALLEWAYAKSAPKILIEEFVTSRLSRRPRWITRSMVFDAQGKDGFLLRSSPGTSAAITPTAAAQLDDGFGATRRLHRRCPTAAQSCA